jgi:hypothetical protein
MKRKRVTLRYRYLVVWFLVCDFFYSGIYLFISNSAKVAERLRGWLQISYTPVQIRALASLVSFGVLCFWHSLLLVGRILAFYVGIYKTPILISSNQKICCTKELDRYTPCGLLQFPFFLAAASEKGVQPAKLQKIVLLAGCQNSAKILAPVAPVSYQLVQSAVRMSNRGYTHHIQEACRVGAH